MRTAAVVADLNGRVIAELPASRALRDRLRHVRHLQRAVSGRRRGRRTGDARWHGWAGRTAALPRSGPPRCTTSRPSKLTLAERTYRCGDESCGHVADRDVNAAANLAAWGEHTLGICPCVTQAGDRHPGGPSAERARHACGGWVSPAASQAAAVPPGEAGTSRPRLGMA